MNIWTIGHSTRAAQDFGEILLAHNIETLVDVRTFPTSRRHPQFNKPALSASLANLGVTYRHEPRLGGRRTPRKDSHNTAWQNAGFRGYADHMETEEFKQGLQELLELSGKTRTAKLCPKSTLGDLCVSAISASSIAASVVNAENTETQRSQRLFKPFFKRLLGQGCTAIMCAEAVWWKCHRSLIADYLKAAGHTVIHIVDAKKTEEHPFTSAARIVNGELNYRGLI